MMIYLNIVYLNNKKKPFFIKFYSFNIIQFTFIKL